MRRPSLVVGMLARAGRRRVLAVPEGPAEPLSGGRGERRGAAERRKPDGGNAPLVADLDQQLGDPHGREPRELAQGAAVALYEAGELARDPLLIWVALGDLGAITNQQPDP